MRKWGHMKFYFNVAGAIDEPDQEGHELATVSDARLVAAKLSAEMLHDRPELAWLGQEFRVEVADHNRTLLFKIITLGIDTADGRALD